MARSYNVGSSLQRQENVGGGDDGLRRLVNRATKLSGVELLGRACVNRRFCRAICD